MNESKFLQDGYARQSHMLYEALELCRDRASLALVLDHEGIMDSRFGPEEQWVKNTGGITFRLKKAARFRQFGEPRWFHRLYVQCPCCSKNVPAGRLHQHARVHVAGRLHRSEKPLIVRPTCSIYPPHWYVDADGDWRRTPPVFQREFPEQPAGFEPQAKSWPRAKSFCGVP